MPTFNEMLDEFPEKSQHQLQGVWDGLPLPMQKELQKALGRLPGDVKLWRMLLGLALSQAKIAFGDKQSVAIVGPANVGKSTLYNQLIREKVDRAAVSAVPGTTRVNQAADAGLFSLTDTPGADAAGQVGDEEKAHAMEAASDADFLVIAFDATTGIRRTEQALFKEFAALGKPMIVVLNKIDLVRREARKVVERAALNLELELSQVVAISARDGTNVE